MATELFETPNDDDGHDGLKKHASPRLRLVDTKTGEVLCEDCQRQKEEAARANLHLDDAEKELRQYRAKVRRLENERAKERMLYKRRNEIEAVFDEWKKACNHKRSKLTPDRFDAIQAKLEMDYSTADISYAIAFIAAFPFVVNAERKSRGRPTQRYDDIELICRTGKNLERFANLGYMHLRDQKRNSEQPRQNGRSAASSRKDVQN